MCKKMSGKIKADEHIGIIEEILALEIYRKEHPFFLKRLAEIYMGLGKPEKARYYLNMSLELKPGLSGVENLRKRIAYS